MRVLTLAALAALVFGALDPAPAPSPYATVSLPTDRILMPKGKVSAVMVLLSSADGWDARAADIARRWAEEGAIVIGVDLPTYYTAIAAEKRDCHYLVSDIERLTRQIHRSEEIESYHTPVVAGLEEGATLALAIAAQTPVTTIAATLAVDPGEVVPLAKPLCTPAPKRPEAGGMVYGLGKGPLPDPVTVILTQQVKPAGRRHVAMLKDLQPAIAIETAAAPSELALAERGVALISSLARAATALDLPLVEMETTPRHDIMAVIYSGDGGWRDIDRRLAVFLQAEGIPVVGVDALRYFWSEKSPEATASDLSRIIATYRTRFGVSRVALIGYSFGADILPATYGELSEADQAAVDLVSLLALSRKADFEIAVKGWLGLSGKGRHGDPVDQARLIAADKLQCVYGKAEKDSGCRALLVSGDVGPQIVERPGGHHFDGNYKVIADQILERLRAG